ncbi:MAG TPA: hypothetical protein VK674_04350 [Candidatus Limnocylindria bacterium]|nr:hypothetical protein [Candidatus Limnocylindria bacterium]
MDREKGFLERACRPILAGVAVLALGGLACGGKEGSEEGASPTTNGDDIEVTVNSGNAPLPTRGPEVADDSDTLCGEYGPTEGVTHILGKELSVDQADNQALIVAMQSLTNGTNNIPDLLWTDAQFKVRATIRLGVVNETLLAEYNSLGSDEPVRQAVDIADRDGDGLCEVGRNPSAELDERTSVSLANRFDNSLVKQTS